MRSFGDALLFVAVHNVGREKLYLSTRHRIRILFSYFRCGSRFLSLATTQKLIRWIRWVNCRQQVTLPIHWLRISVN